ncbi:MAG: crossover junction endodeoxyribonuclease RuvC [Anaerolineae bacterium]|nr:crossover junction endodeoxyribonuclease RuvC [Anaerolineae bacterium]
MRILGIDPGLQTTGFGVVDVASEGLTYVASGTISTTHLDRGQLPLRLKVLFDGVREVVATYQPDHASVEIVFVNINPQATLLLGQARGACVTALVSQELPVSEYTALQMKQAITGHGKAAKSQVQEMVKRQRIAPIGEGDCVFLYTGHGDTTTIGGELVHYDEWVARGH